MRKPPNSEILRNIGFWRYLWWRAGFPYPVWRSYALANGSMAAGAILGYATTDRAPLVLLAEMWLLGNTLLTLTLLGGFYIQWRAVLREAERKEAIKAAR